MGVTESKLKALMEQGRELRDMYDYLCEEYRRRLCRQWDIRLDNTWWIADIIGDELAFDDEWVLEMTEVKCCVDNAITYEAFDEYWRFIINEAHNGRVRPRINFRSWFRGLRPSDLNRGDSGGAEDAEISPCDRPADENKENGND